MTAVSRGLSLADGVHAVFPTPLLVRRFGAGDIEDRLREIVLAKEASTEGVRQSNVRGWHSKADLLSWSDPEIGELKSRINDGLMVLIEQARNPAWTQEFKSKLAAWANVSRDGAYNSIHNHAPALFSGVYYVATGDPAKPGTRDGLIEFIDPRPGPHGGPIATHAFNAPLIVDPEPGMLVIFPGWLLHFVHPYHGREPRVSIAFNLTIKPAG